MNWDVPLKLVPCCQHLRHKLMYCDPRQAVPGAVDAESETRVYLCSKTQEVLGPDDQPVGPGDCATSRGCYCGSALPVVVATKGSGAGPGVEHSHSQ